MKTVFVIALFLCTLTTHPSYSQNDLAKVYIVRYTGYRGSPISNSVFIDKKLECRLQEEKFSIHYLKPGDHIFTVQFMGKKPNEMSEPISIHTEAGKIYYVELVLRSDKLFCQEVTENSAKIFLAKCTAQEKCL